MPSIGKKGGIRMTDRTLVKITKSPISLDFRTIRFGRKSSRQFNIFRDDILKLKNIHTVVVENCGDFAILRRDQCSRTISIQFTWLSSARGQVRGWEETVTLPYDSFLDFAERNKQSGGSEKWALLSLKTKNSPKLVFCEQKSLCAAIKNKTVRRKLFRFLRSNFRWQGTDEIRLYDDFVPYSFSFQEFVNGTPGICGRLILHGQDDLTKAYYSIHT